MAVGADRVQVLKHESTAGGGQGSQAARYPKEIKPQEDALEAAGIFLQDASNHDEAVYVAREGQDMVLCDQRGTATLTQLRNSGEIILAGSGLTKVSSTLNVGANADGSIQVNADDIQVGVLASDAQHGARGGGTQHAAASASNAGFMQAVDFTKLASIPAPTFFYAYSTATATFTTTALTIPFTTVVQNQPGGAFTFDSATGQLTCQSTGVYAVRADIAVVRTTGAAAAYCEVRLWCELNAVEVAHTSTQAACDSQGITQTTSINALLTVFAGQVLRVRCVRTVGSQTITLEPTCRISVERKL